MTDTLVAAPFHTMTLAELLALQIPELEWAVDGVLPLGSFTLLAAREKAGKSLLAVDLCCSVALGETFMDRAVRQGPALLVPAEENIRDVRARIIQRMNGREDADLRVLPVNGFTEDVLRIDQGDSLMRLLATIEELRPVVVVLDPMRELHNLAENDADDMGPMLRPLRQIAHATNTALLMNHHMSRMGTSRGSTAIRASVDQEWAFKRTDNEEVWESSPSEGTLRVEGRFGPRQMVNLRLGEFGRWDVSNIPIVPDGSIRARILEALRRAPAGLDADELTRCLDSPKKTIQNALANLIRESIPPIQATGKGIKGDPRRFVAIDPLLFDTFSGSNRNNVGNDFVKSSYNGHVTKIIPDVPVAIGGNHFGNDFGNNPMGVYVCDQCALPRSLDGTKCPNCGATKGHMR